MSRSSRSPEGSREPETVFVRHMKWIVWFGIALLITARANAESLLLCGMEV